MKTHSRARPTPTQPTQPGAVPLYRSRFRRRWYGIRLVAAHTDGCSYYLVVKTARGLPIPRRVVMCLNDVWLKPAGTYDVSQLNQDWLRI